MKKNLFYIIALSISLLSLSTKLASASEGTFELKNQVGEDARCYVFSELMPDQRYSMLVSCRDIIYPGGTEVFNYVVWANPLSGGNPVRLGTLDLGKVSFKTDKPFTSLFVTKEINERPKSPAGSVVMKGNLKTITFLDSKQAADNPSSELGDSEVTPTPTAKANPITNNNVFRILAAGGIVAFLGLFGVILVIFIVSRR